MAFGVQAHQGLIPRHHPGLGQREMLTLLLHALAELLAQLIPLVRQLKALQQRLARSASPRQAVGPGDDPGAVHRELS